jgi:hypothetical protein
VTIDNNYLLPLYASVFDNYIAAEPKIAFEKYRQ